MPSSVSILSVTKLRPGLHTMTVAAVIFIQLRGAQSPTSPPHSSRRIPTDKPIDFLGGHAVEISRHGLLQRAGRDGESECVLGGPARDQAVDEPAGEAVAS